MGSIKEGKKLCGQRDQSCGGLGSSIFGKHKLDHTRLLKNVAQLASHLSLFICCLVDSGGRTDVGSISFDSVSCFTAEDVVVVVAS